jgi:type VI secretion system protein
MALLKYRYWRLLRRSSSSCSSGLVILVLTLFMTVGQLLTGCSAMSGLVTGLTPSGTLVNLQKFALSADRLSNNGSPVAVDLVLILDQKPLLRLGSLRASEWFNNRLDLQRQYPNQLKVTSWEIVPGQVIAPQTVMGDQGKLVGVLVFADYPGERSFRTDASNMPTVRVHLSKTDFSISTF